MMSEREKKQKEKIYNHVKQIFLLRHPYCEDCLNTAVFNVNGKRRKTWTKATHFIQDETPNFEGEEFKKAIDMRRMHHLCEYHFQMTK